MWGAVHHHRDYVEIEINPPLREAFQLGIAADSINYCRHYFSGSPRRINAGGVLLQFPQGAKGEADHHSNT